MAAVKATTRRVVHGPPDEVFAAVCDYAGTRRQILTGHYRDYEVREGGTGAGTLVHWKLAATSKRVRDCLVRVSEPGETTLVETDANSSLVTTWTVRPSGTDASTVEVSSTWKGAGGIGGIFEGIFAPLGLRRIYDAMLANLQAALTRDRPAGDA